MPRNPVNDVLRRARETLEIAKLGLVDVTKHPSRRLSGLSNLVVFGRAVTNVLQNLRSISPGFDSWYEPLKRELAADPLMKFFYGLRSRILKRGETGVAGYTHIKKFEFPVDMARFGAPPQNARSFFIGDSVGGTGWEVEVAPGVMEKYYVEVPSEIGTAGLYFRNAPGIDISSTPNNADIAPLCSRYIERLEKIVESAEAEFGGK